MKHGGKKEGLERRLEKEEREYVEAAQDEHNESRAIEELKAAAENARSKVCSLRYNILKGICANISIERRVGDTSAT